VKNLESIDGKKKYSEPNLLADGYAEE